MASPSSKVEDFTVKAEPDCDPEVKHNMETNGQIIKDPHAEMNIEPELEYKEDLRVKIPNFELDLEIKTKLSPPYIADNGADSNLELTNKSGPDSAVENESIVEGVIENLPEESDKPKPSPSPLRKFGCELCGMTFTKKSNIDKHLRIHTGEKPFPCTECDAAFTSKSNRNIHMRLHTGEKPYKCDLCEAAFVQKSHLLKHRTIHTGDKELKCEFCSIVFTEISALVTHKKIHDGEVSPLKKKPKKSDDISKPYKCELCDAAFRHRGRLVTHAKVHSGVKPHKCETCSATFSKRGSLTIHTRIHTGIKPFTCLYCNAAFSQKGSLTIHQKVHRAENSEETASFKETQTKNSTCIETAGIYKTPPKESLKTSDFNQTLTNYTTPTKLTNSPSNKIDSPKINKEINGVNRKEMDGDKKSKTETPRKNKKMKPNETADKCDNMFALDPVDPVFSDFITAMHQKANTGEITTEMIFQ